MPSRNSSRRRTSMMTTDSNCGNGPAPSLATPGALHPPAGLGPGTGAGAGRFFTTAAARRSASQIAALSNLAEGSRRTSSGHGKSHDGTSCCDGGGVGGKMATSSRAGGRSQLPSNILKRMFGRNSNADASEHRRGSNDTCPDEEDGDNDQEGDVTVRDLGYNEDQAGSNAPASASAPRRSSLRRQRSSTCSASAADAPAAVTFDQNVRFLTIPHLDSFSVLQRTQLYYDRDEYADLQENIKDDIRVIRRRQHAASAADNDGDDSNNINEKNDKDEENTNEEDQEGPCPRGIEHYLLPREERLARTEAASAHVVELLRCQNSLLSGQQQQQEQQQQQQSARQDRIRVQLAAKSLQLSGPARHLARETGRTDEEYARRAWGQDLRGSGSAAGIDISYSDGDSSSPSSSSSSWRSRGSSSGSTKNASASTVLPLPPLAADDSNEERARCA